MISQIAIPGKMSKKALYSIIPDEIIFNKIYFIRGYKVMLDRDRARMYEVPTKALKQAVKRNMDIFPEQFMFEMAFDEFVNWRSQIVTSNLDKMGLRYHPFCFTEHGIAEPDFEVVVRAMKNQPDVFYANEFYNENRNLINANRNQKK
jgi:ORF6N domain